MFENGTQHRCSAGFLACLSYAACSTALTLANKYIFSHEFDFPWTLLSIQSAVVAIMLVLVQLVTNTRIFSLHLLVQMLFPCVLFTMFIFSNSQALRFISLPILSVIKSLAPMGIALAERAMFGDTISTETIIPMCLIVLSNVVTMVNDIEFSFKAYVWAIGNVTVNIAYVVSLRACLSDSFSPIEKTLHSNVIATTIMLPLSLASGEMVPFLKAIKQTDYFFRLVYLISCVLAAGIGASVFWVVQTTSGSTLSFVGSCNKFVVVILGGILFKTRITPVGWLSVSLGVLAGILFTRAKARGSRYVMPEDQDWDVLGDDEGAPGAKRLDSRGSLDNLETSDGES